MVGPQLTGDIRAAAISRSLMMRRTHVGQYGQRLIGPEPEPGFGMVDVIADALRLCVGVTVHA